MKHQIIYISLLIIIVFIAGSAFQSGKNSSPCDAPLLGAGHSGAPGEVNCSGCHSGTPNTGPGSLFFDLGGGTTQYTPGQTYTATVKLSQASVDKFGFQVIALKDGNNTFTGNYTLTDSANTRIINGTGGKQYVGTTQCGSDAAGDSIQWSFDWTAPLTDEGSITLYLSSLATNHSHSTAGDDTYTKTLQLSSTSTGINTISMMENGFQIYPNPASGNVTIQYLLEENTTVKISILDIDGKEVGVVISENQQAGEHNYLMDVTKKGYAPGVYVIKVNAGEQIFTKKLQVIQ